MTETADHSCNCQPACPLFQVGAALQPLLKVDQAASYLQTSSAYIYRQIDAGRLKALSLPVESKNGDPVTRRVLRIKASDLQDFMESLKVVN